MMRTASASSASVRSDRRSFLARSLGGAATAVAATGAPLGGLFAAGRERLSIGLIGCGGRGTGAAVQAALGCPAVEITCLADRFADQLAGSADRLERLAGAAFRCPPERRHVGADAWRSVIDSDVDLVILATPPHLRPAQAAAAVAAGKHVWCETPAAVDLAGIGLVATACAAARRMGLSFASGLCSRHDPDLAAVMARIHAGDVGRPRAVVARHEIGLPWIRPAGSTSSTAEWRLRNWIWLTDLSGGPLVEHHADALDRGLWALGDMNPVCAIPLPPPAPSLGARPATEGPGGGDRLPEPGGLAVRYAFADGRTLDAVVARRSGPPDRIAETARCRGGAIDLRAPVATAAARPVDPHAAAMQRLTGGVLRGDRIDDGHTLVRVGHAAVLGRLACEAGHALPWAPLPAAGPQPV